MGTSFYTSDWNKYVAEYHAEAHKWVLADVPRQVSVFEDKKLTNAKYKYAVHICKKKKKADLLEEKLLCNNMTGFWKEVRVCSNCRISLQNTVEGISGTNNIVA